MKSYHILNGDCLADNFPAEIPGEMIVWRECLIDGPVNFKNFFEIRKKYLDHVYRVDADYEEMVVSEWLKITKIPAGSKVYLWFEEDAFCQANLWFLLAELQKYKIAIFRILTDFSSNIFEGFGNSNSNELLHLFQNPVEASARDLESGSDLWKSYAEDDYVNIEEISKYKSSFFPHLKESAHAVIEVRTDAINAVIHELKKEYKDDWESAFKIFSSQHPQNGLGDLQFKKRYF